MGQCAGGSYLQPLDALEAGGNTLGRGRVNRLLTGISPFKILMYIFKCFISVD